MVDFKSRIKFLFFDLGGTILDLSCCYLGVVEAWRELRITSRVSPAELTRLWADLSQEFIGSREPKGPRGVFETTTDAMTVAMSQLSIPGDHKVAAKLTEAAWRAVRKKAKPFPDALPGVFRELKTLGYSLGIITDGDPDVIDDLLPRVPCFELFEVVVCSWEVGTTKPNARIFARALESSGSLPRNTAFVGDAPADVQGAKSADMFTVIVDRFGTYVGRPSPDLIVESLGELPHALQHTNW